MKEQSQLQLQLQLKYPPINPAQKAVLYKEQDLCCKRMLDAIRDGTNGLILRVDAGLGKTYALGQLIRFMHDSDLLKGTLSPYPVIYVTKSSVVTQTKDVLVNDFGLSVPKEVFVINYDAMRASFGELFIDKQVIHVHGDPVEIWTWRPVVRPIVMIYDECQALKNDDSKQHKFALSFTNVDDGSPKIQIFASATPFSRISAAKIQCVASSLKVSYGGRSDIPLTKENWPIFANSIATKGDPKIYSKAALKRLLSVLKPNIFTYKIRPEFPPENAVALIDFDSDGDRIIYNLAWERYLEESAKIKQKQLSYMLELAQITIFRQAAELLRAPRVAKEIAMRKELGFSTGLAACYKATIARVVIELIEKYNFTRNDISLIWGGEAALGGAEEQFSQQEIEDLFAAAMNGERIPDSKLSAVIRQLKIQKAGLTSIPKEYRLGIQSRVMRNSEIERYMTGKSKAALFTFQAGGVGLSLHHYKLTGNGGPREGIFTPTYNEMEMDQALFRLARLNSISTTKQVILLYKGTIEVAVLKRLNAKRHALSAIREDPEENVSKYADDILNKTRKERDEDYDEEHEADEVYEEEN